MEACTPLRLLRMLSLPVMSRVGVRAVTPCPPRALPRKGWATRYQHTKAHASSSHAKLGAAAPTPSTSSSTHSRSNSDTSPSPIRPFWRAVAWLPVILFLTGHVVSVANVRGTSMSPTFNPIEPEEIVRPSHKPTTDIVLLNRLVTASRDFKKGDIVTLYSPSDPNKIITKRILALGGDTIHLWVPRDANLAPTSRKGLPDHVVSLAYTNIYQNALQELAHEIEDHASGAWLSITIPPHCAWVEGDASAHKPIVGDRLYPESKSRDSREFGPVPLGLITSRVSCILWPPSRFGPPGPRPT